MSKAGATPLQRLKEQLQAVDLLFEVRDARAPESSMHPKTKEFFGTKPRIIVLCKEDLADPRAALAWIESKRQTGDAAIALSLKSQKGKDKLFKLALELSKSKLEARQRRGLLPRPIRVAVVGLPNVGKSSLINWLVGKKKAAVANTPGVTRANSWIRISPQIELLDTPGMLPMVSFKGEQAMKLALCNILPQDHYDNEEAASYALEFLRQFYAESLEPFKTSTQEENGCSLEAVARARACLKAGNQLDLKRAAAVFLSEFRAGRLGRFLLDKS